MLQRGTITPSPPLAPPMVPDKIEYISYMTSNYTALICLVRDLSFLVLLDIGGAKLFGGVSNFLHCFIGLRNIFFIYDWAGPN